jgi:hypothetical protein
MHSYSNMYAYGMPKGRYQQQGQSFCYQTGTGYAFGFNGQIKTDNISGEGNHNTALFWEYDTRLGRRWNVDPVDQISLSNYAGFGNNPISRIDPMGNTTVTCSRNPSDGQVHTGEGNQGSGNSKTIEGVVCHAKPKATAATSSGAGSSTGGGGAASAGGGTSATISGIFAQNGVPRNTQNEENSSIVRKIWDAVDIDINMEGKLMGAGAEINAGKFLSLKGNVGVLKANGDVSNLSGDLTAGYAEGAINIAGAINYSGKLSIAKVECENLAAWSSGVQPNVNFDFLKVSGGGGLGTLKSSIGLEFYTSLYNYSTVDGAKWGKSGYKHVSESSKGYGIGLNLSVFKFKVSFDPTKL